jgi:hypothetical protein
MDNQQSAYLPQRTYSSLLPHAPAWKLWKRFFMHTWAKLFYLVDTLHYAQLNMRINLIINEKLLSTEQHARVNIVEDVDWIICTNQFETF